MSFLEISQTNQILPTQVETTTPISPEISAEQRASVEEYIDMVVAKRQAELESLKLELNQATALEKPFLEEVIKNLDKYCKTKIISYLYDELGQPLEFADILNILSDFNGEYTELIDFVLAYLSTRGYDDDPLENY